MSLGLKVMRELAAVMRDERWKVSASVMKKSCSSEIIRGSPGNGHHPSMGPAIDIGTTSIVV